MRGRYFQFRIIKYKAMGTIGTCTMICAMATAVWELVTILGYGSWWSAVMYCFSSSSLRWTELN